MKRPRWILKSGLDRRFRSGHPWVFSNELSHPPKGIEAGEPIELFDPSGKFLARGYGNPHSLIAFRTLTRREDDENPWGAEFLQARLAEALELRLRLGYGPVSFRLCFGEADYLPGLVIDRYAREGKGQLFVAQAHTAGADRWIGLLPEVLQALSEKYSLGGWGETAVLIRNDLAVRSLEGIQPEEPRVVKAWSLGELGEESIRVPTLRGSGLSLRVSLSQGQKTAFYLDQSANIHQLCDILSRAKPTKLKILDLCSYVGQWGSQIAHTLQGTAVEVTAVDASQGALDLARKNILASGAKTVEVVKADVIGGLSALPTGAFDVVIADPPALIKSRKHLPEGKHAYLQLNTEVFRLVKKGGWVTSCSCSALLGEEDFLEAIAKAARRNQVRFRLVARGGHAPDHPVLAEFPEGRYLKAWIGS